MPPVWPSPRPLIFPNGTPQAATIGPTASVVLSPTPPVECLSTTRRPSARAEVDRLAASHHRVRERERLGAREPLEVDGHAERGELVVGHVAARVREDELRDLFAGKLLPVPLALDELGRPDHRGPSATKTTCRVVSWIVELHGARIGCPGMPRDGAFPLSQALTVAPTSANSPSWICPAAFRPAT